MIVIRLLFLVPITFIMLTKDEYPIHRKNRKNNWGRSVVFSVS